MEAHPLPCDMQAFLDKHGYLKDGHIDQLLFEDIGQAFIDAAKALETAYWVQLDQPRQYALIDMAFNIGGHGISKFKKFLAAIRERNWEQAAAEIRNSKYYRQLGGDPVGTDDGILERPEEIMEIIKTGRLIDG